MNTSPAPASTPVPGARAALLLLIGINLFNYIDRQVLSAMVGPIKASLSEGGRLDAGPTLQALMSWVESRMGFQPEDALMGLLGTAFMATYTLCAPLFGWLGQRHARWLLVAIGVILWSAASGASGLATGFVALLLTRCFVGIGEAAYGPVAPTLIADLYPVHSRGRMLSWFYMAIPVGSALGYVLGGAVAGSGIGAWGEAQFGIQAESWRWAFFLVVPPGILLGVAALFMRDPLRHPSPQRAAGAGGSLRTYLGFLRNRSYLLCTLGMTAMTFALGGIAFWMPYFLQSLPGAPAQSTLIFGVITVLAGLTGTLAGGLAGDWLRRRTSGAYFLVSGAGMLVGCPIFLAALYAPFPGLWLLLFAGVFCLFFNTGPSNTIIANVTPPHLRTAAFALNIFVIHAFGDVISPVIIGLLSDVFQAMRPAFVLMSLMMLASGLLWLAGARHLARDMERAAAA